ncbi:MAG: Spy/CpxP family protein refolding chaperone [Bacteroidetes bacterium]|nr:Spy/CpxP family protein refolding chaperone [Rhodothermia bacterium]MCS7154689.1 Spy/CpxP family protein refolding chaperone [Bacteroidota bacterium]MCX7907154.1 Spy/CpxP family protein refolding chaperone [Bacteroidota bacterium]MDW8137482.1 Spy/CpxP family protein refolding chaperone [Bacteroidota bacterium]MDW8285564.1 Spy/CpxP family protein refolding chaperone [Bacteroidota bacterium]
MRARWLWPVLLGVLIFAAGIGAGVFVDRFLLHSRFRGGPELLLLERRTWAKVRQELALTPEQARRLEEITRAHAQQMNALRQRFRRELRAMAQRYREAIRPVLTDAQWERLERLRRERRLGLREEERRFRRWDTLRPAPPKPMDTLPQEP